jgi:hypothetical protein
LAHFWNLSFTHNEPLERAAICARQSSKRKRPFYPARIPRKPVSIIPLTVFVGFLLVAFFVCLFLYQAKCSARTGPDRDALLPLNDEKIRPSGSVRPKTSPALPKY